VFDAAVGDPEFNTTHQHWLDRRFGRPTPLTPLDQLSAHHGGARLLVKREDVGEHGNFTAISAFGQALLARQMGKALLVSETATGDFGVSVGAAAAALGMRATVFMGRVDHQLEGQKVELMRRLGVDVQVVDADVRGRKDAAVEALRFWSSHLDDTFYCASSAAAPDPYPRMLAFFLASIGSEMKVQLRRAGISPTYVVAPVGSGSLATGVFGAFVDDLDVQLVGVHGGGPERGCIGSPLVNGARGIFLGTHSYVLSDELGQVLEPETAAAGLAMPTVAPQLARWATEGTILFNEIFDDAAEHAVERALAQEGLLFNLETGHALAYAERLLPTLSEDDTVVVVATGVGDSELARWTRTREEM
jgi:tryptophan synthase beta chain